LASILFGFSTIFSGLEGLMFGIPLILSGGLLLVISDLMVRTTTLEKRYDELVNAVNALNKRNENNSTIKEL
jgi:hypothetical protein